MSVWRILRVAPSALALLALAMALPVQADDAPPRKTAAQQGEARTQNVTPAGAGGLPIDQVTFERVGGSIHTIHIKNNAQPVEKRYDFATEAEAQAAYCLATARLPDTWDYINHRLTWTTPITPANTDCPATLTYAKVWRWVSNEREVRFTKYDGNKCKIYATTAAGAATLKTIADCASHDAAAATYEVGSDVDFVYQLPTGY